MSEKCLEFRAFINRKIPFVHFTYGEPQLNAYRRVTHSEVFNMSMNFN